jgi:hypothetical protein
MQQFFEGTLTIRPVSAQITHDTDFFSKMDPFVVFIHGQERHKTHTCKGGGKHPKWNDYININVSTQDNIFIEIWDDDTFSKNKLIAVGEIHVSKIAQVGRLEEWINIFYDKKSAGTLMLEATYTPIQQQQQIIINQNTNQWGQPTIQEKVIIQENVNQWGQPTIQEKVVIQENVNQWGQPTIQEKVIINENQHHHHHHNNNQFQEKVVIQENFNQWGQPTIQEKVIINENQHHHHHNNQFQEQVVIQENVNQWGQPTIQETVVIKENQHHHHHHHNY